MIFNLFISLLNKLTIEFLLIDRWTMRTVIIDLERNFERCPQNGAG